MPTIEESPLGAIITRPRRTRIRVEAKKNNLNAEEESHFHVKVTGNNPISETAKNNFRNDGISRQNIIDLGLDPDVFEKSNESAGTPTKNPNNVNLENMAPQTFTRRRISSRIGRINDTANQAPETQMARLQEDAVKVENRDSQTFLRPLRRRGLKGGRIGNTAKQDRENHAAGLQEGAVKVENDNFQTSLQKAESTETINTSQKRKRGLRSYSVVNNATETQTANLKEGQIPSASTNAAIKKPESIQFQRPQHKRRKTEPGVKSDLKNPFTAAPSIQTPET